MTDDQYMTMPMGALGRDPNVEIVMGRFINIIILPSGTMVLELTKEGWGEAAEINLRRKCGSGQYRYCELSDLVDDFIGNGWYVGTGDQFGHMTSAPLFARNYGCSEETGEPQPEPNDEEWLYMDYQVLNIVEELQKYGRVALVYAEAESA